MRQTRAVFRLLSLLVATAILATAAEAADKIPATSNSTKAVGFFMEGRKLVDDLRLTDAIPYFQKALKEDGNFALAHLFMAQAAPIAKTFFEEMHKAEETSAGTSHGEQLMIKGFIAGVNARPGVQLELYQELAKEYPDDERAQMLVGTAYFAQQEYTEAVDHLKKAVDTAPGFAPAYNQLGYAYRALERYDEAEATFKKYTELLPTDPNPFDSYAELLLKIGRFDESAAQYQKALAVNPHFANSFTGIAACMMYQNRHVDALAEIQKEIDAARNPGETRLALFTRAVVYMDEGKSDMAMKEINRECAIAEKLKDAGSMSGDRFMIATILLEEGKSDEAMAEFKRSNDIVQESSLAADVKAANALFHHANVARVMIQKGDLASARTETDALRQEAEKRQSRNQMRLAHELSGLIALEQKDYAGAITELKQANQQDPRVLYNIALASQASGKTDDARSYAKAAAKFYGLPFMNYACVRTKAEKLLAAL
ncbi:MAG TPA: tetratricopeptide repeat protein [Bacteroidota bacterium]|nr:tetratricopeptide repeat protein [Bacteroidota bacterium]